MPLPLPRFSALVVVFYAGMAAMGVAWMWLRDRPLLALVAPAYARPEAGPPPLLGQSIALDLALGGAVGSGIVWLTGLLDRRFAWARTLSDRLTSAIPPLSGTEIVLCAAFSSIGEELFFRGAMQDAFGLVVTMLVFGFLHGGTDRRLWTWAGFALVAGAVFSALVAVTGTLLGAILAHGLINGLNLRALLQRRPLHCEPPGSQ